MTPQQQKRRTKKASPFFSSQAAVKSKSAEEEAESSNTKKRKSTRQLAKRSSSNKKTKKAESSHRDDSSSNSSNSDNESRNPTTTTTTAAAVAARKGASANTKSTKAGALAVNSRKTTTTRQPAKATRTNAKQKSANPAVVAVDDDNQDESSESSDDNNHSSDDDFQSPPPIKKRAAHVKPNSNQVDSRKKIQQQPAQKKNQKKKAVGNKEEEEEEDDEESPHTCTSASTIIDIPRPKGAPFADALSPDLLQFLAELKEDNNRDFMRINEKRWQTIRKDFMDFVKMISEQLNEMDPSVLVEEPKNAIYRQHRDLRFTNDLRPYKTYMSASFSRGGKKSPFAGYYIGVAPNGETHVAAGIWQPSPPRIARIREGIVAHADLMREALSLPSIKETFGQNGLAVLSDEDKLKTAPKNYPKDHPEIELLRYKSFVISKTFTDLDVVSEGFLDKVLDVYEALVPFITILNSWTG